MTDETASFDPPMPLEELVELANREDEALAVTVLLCRFLTTVKKRGFAPEPVVKTLEVFGLVEVPREAAKSFLRGYLPARLSLNGIKVAAEMML